MSAGIEGQKPKLRGRLHQIAFFVVVPAGIALVLLARSPSARVAAAIYALSLAGLFGVSAAYHRLPWSPRARPRMKRLDHSMIFVLIAGTYTPIALLVLRGAWSIAILSIVWAGAAAGITLKIVRIDGFNAAGGALYIALGWLAIIALPKIIHGLPGPAIGLSFAGGLIYTGGAIVLLTKRPDPNPALFGYHEIWHSMVIAACACFYAVTLLVVLRAG